MPNAGSLELYAAIIRLLVASSYGVYSHPQNLGSSEGVIKSGSAGVLPCEFPERPARHPRVLRWSAALHSARHRI